MLNSDHCSLAANLSVHASLGIFLEESSRFICATVDGSRYLGNYGCSFRLVGFHGLVGWAVHVHEGEHPPIPGAVAIGLGQAQGVFLRCIVGSCTLFIDCWLRCIKEYIGPGDVTFRYRVVLGVLDEAGRSSPTSLFGICLDGLRIGGR